MKPLRRTASRAFTLLLTLSLLALYAPFAVVQSQTQNVGILKTTGDKNIQVNKSNASTGATVVDGALLETSDCVSGFVRILPLGADQSEANEIGRIELSNNSSAVVNYSADRLSLTLTRGCAVIHTRQNISGVINTPDGKSVPAAPPDTLNRQRAETCFPANTKADYVPHCAAIPPVIFVLGGAGAAATTAAVIVSSRGENPSPDTPFVR